MVSQLKSLSLSYSQLYNYFYAYSFDKIICEILKSSKIEYAYSFDKKIWEILKPVEKLKKYWIRVK